ncbi:MAG: helix-turn-helix transcriptional regulator [Lachnospiraceae bacterium]|nr:helix-turn-helix transcriptional regulator [Lachnospiraceae bacterium]
MITYNPLWETMKKKKITQYALINKYHVSPGQITRLKRNESVSTHTIDMLCRILNCSVSSVMMYVSDCTEK